MTDTEPIRHAGISSAGLNGRALRIVVQHFPNGVDRLLDAELVPLDAAVAESALPGRVRIAFPLPSRFADLMADALARMGYDSGAFQRWLCDSWARAITADVVEIIAWRKA